MIMQVGTDSRLVERSLNTEFRQLRGRAYPGQHQDVRRADGARCQDHLATAACDALLAILLPPDSGDAPARPLQSFDKATGLKLKVLPMQNRLEESTRGRPTPAALLIDVEVADAFVVAGVEVIDGGNAVLVCGLPEGVQDLPGQTRILDPPFPSGRMVLAFQKMIDVL